VNLAPGFLLQVAPRFHVAALWPTRLEIGSGIEPTPAGFFPRDAWRAPSAEELDLLTAVTSPAEALSPSHAGLFALPSHIVDRWWQAVDDEGAASGAAFERFVHETVDFFRFKQMPLPDSCSFDVRVSRAGQRSTRLDTSGRFLSGLAFADAPGCRTVAWANLGDEDARLVYLNLPLDTLRPRARATSIAAGDEVLARFCEAEAEYPLIRLRLGPGEGLWFPHAPIAHDGDTQEKLDLDAVLTLSCADA